METHQRSLLHVAIFLTGIASSSSSFAWVLPNGAIDCAPALKGLHSPFLPTADVMAPRFINMPTWIAKTSRGNYDPHQIYEPAPATWQGWDLAITDLDHQARAFATGQVPLSQLVISKDWLISMERIALAKSEPSRAGVPRTLTQTVGRQWSRADAPSIKEISALQDDGYARNNLTVPACPLVNRR